MLSQRVWNGPLRNTGGVKEGDYSKAVCYVNLKGAT